MLQYFGWEKRIIEMFFVVDNALKKLSILNNQLMKKSLLELGHSSFRQRVCSARKKVVSCEKQHQNNRNTNSNGDSEQAMKSWHQWLYKKMFFKRPRTFEKLFFIYFLEKVTGDNISFHQIFH